MLVYEDQVKGNRKYAQPELGRITEEAVPVVCKHTEMKSVTHRMC